MNLKTIFLVAATTFSSIVTIQAQSKAIRNASNAFESGEYYTAINLYKKILPKIGKDGDKGLALFRVGQSYSKIGDFKGAETYFAKAIAAKYDDPEAVLRLAESKKMQMKYEEAIIEYKKFSNLSPSDERGKNGEKFCEEAKNWQKKPTRWKVDNMALINTKDAEYAPAYADNKKYSKLYFVSTREGSLGGKVDGVSGGLHEDIFETAVDKNGKWSTPVPLPEPTNSVFNEGALIVSKKGDFAILSRCPEDKFLPKKMQLYKLSKRGGGWADPEVLNFCVDTLTYGQPSLSKDGLTLYFVSDDLENGQGKHDIYISKYDVKEKKWGVPTNAGPNVNTPGDEYFPFITSDDNALYFSSDYHQGMGGLDIFKCTKTANGSFTAAENLKSPMNSPQDDFGVLFEGVKERGYFCSNREGGRGSDDIYSFYLPPLAFKSEGSVLDAVNNKPVPNVTVKCLTKKGVYETKTDKTGKYTFNLDPEENYELYTETDATITTPDYPKGFLASTERGKFTTIGVNESQNFKKDFVLTPVTDEIKFGSVLFELAKWDVNAPYTDTLDFLFKTLSDNPTLVIELSAHTDSRADGIYNDTLSSRRARAAKDYLVKDKGINPKRIEAVGYGEKKLLIKDDVITKEKVKQVQEALHAKNRRVVFSVLSWDFVDPAAPSKPPVLKPKVVGEERSEDIEDNDATDN